MSAIVLVILAIAVTVPFIAAVAATMLVAGAVRSEERQMTFGCPAPGPCTQLARSLLAVPGRYLAWPEPAGESIPDAERVPSWTSTSR